MTELFGRNLICVFTFIKRWFGWKCTEQAVHQVWEQEEQSVLAVGGGVLCPSVPVRAGLLLPDDTKPDPVLQPALPAPPPDGVPVGHAVSAPPLQDVLDHCHHLYRGTNKTGGLELYYIWYAWVGGYQVWGSLSISMINFILQKIKHHELFLLLSSRYINDHWFIYKCIWYFLSNRYTISGMIENPDIYNYLYLPLIVN